ncbi:MAG: class I SAM-dependent methyltransferase [Pseudomonadota bacterium]
MAFFDFARALPRYFGMGRVVDRLDRRKEFLIDPFRAEISGARVLDLASHDGRWALAFAAAGAREVVGIEGRAELIAEFSAFPDSAEKANVRLIKDDLEQAVRGMADAGERFDVIGVFGIFYHITTHYRLLADLRRLEPGLVIIDSEFLNLEAPVIALRREDPSRDMNALALFDGQQKVVKGVPSRLAMEMMADTLGYRLEWLDWSQLPRNRRHGVRDYFREGEMTRASCVLRPLEPMV